MDEEMMTFEINVSRKFYNQLLEAKSFKENLVNKELTMGEYIEVAFLDFSLAFKFLEEELANYKFPIDTEETRKSYL
jgi:hypothetical protein